ncbi:hypothetical protein [Luteolibacter sp. Populi]|uniref:hypothetical protein n=1 Tax=Luteolibacter sp. Populi TaxID=3230487 RepID=UPI003465E6D9
MSHRFYRSYTFRLGVLLPLFLLWCWVWSTRFLSSVSVDGPLCFLLSQRGAFLRIVAWRDPGLTKWEAPRFENISYQSRFFPGFAWRWQWDREIFDVSFSYWFLLVLSMIPWGLLLLWRRHRHARATRLTGKR